MYAQVIVCPTDFSDVGNRALEGAAQLARETGATLHALHVRTTPFPYDALLYGQVESPLGTEADQFWRDLPHCVELNVQRHVRFGDPAAEILRFVNEVSADLIVMGTHGRGGLTRAMMGSVAEQVMRRADVPVLLLKNTPAPNRLEQPAVSAFAI